MEKSGSGAMAPSTGGEQDRQPVSIFQSIEQIQIWLPRQGSWKPLLTQVKMQVSISYR